MVRRLRVVTVGLGLVVAVRMIVTVGVRRGLAGHSDPVAEHELRAAIGANRHQAEKNQGTERQPDPPWSSGISAPPRQGSDHEGDAAGHEHQVPMNVHEVVPRCVVAHLLGRLETEPDGNHGTEHSEEVKPSTEAPRVVVLADDGPRPGPGGRAPEGDREMHNQRMKVRRIPIVKTGHGDMGECQ